MALKFIAGHDSPDRDGRLPAVSVGDVTVQPDISLPADGHWDDLDADTQQVALEEMAQWSRDPKKFQQGREKKIGNADAPKV